jgi:hypothetical protein
MTVIQNENISEKYFLDVLSIATLDTAGENFIVAHFPEEDIIACGAFGFQSEHPYLKLILEKIPSIYSDECWGCIGPIIALNAALEFCNTKLEDLEYPHDYSLLECPDMKVLHHNYAYPFGSYGRLYHIVVL